MSDEGSAAKPLATKVSIVNPKNLGKISFVEEIKDMENLCEVVTKAHWAPGVFTNDQRVIRDMRSISLLVLDIDSGCTLDNALEQFRDYKHIIATSRNHQKEKNGVVCDRFRVVLFLSETITSDRDFKATWTSAHQRWPFIDVACKDSSRFFYPSPTIVSVVEDGLLFDVSKYVEPEVPVRQATAPSMGAKGELWKSTLEFLLQGAPAGTRHNALVSAVGNMREQGYDQTEVIEALQKMIDVGGDWTPTVTKTDLKTIERMFAREMKYEYKPKQETEKGPSVIVSASELLDEMFDYLSDKDKVKGDPTGIDGLDELLGGGFRTGELTVMMAQGKTGKNTLFHHLIYKQLERGQPFGYASRELDPAKEVLPNLVTIAHKRNAWKETLSDRYREETRGIVSKWQLHFAPGYGHFPIEQMEHWFRTCKDLGVNHFLFDHFHYALLKEDHDSTTTLIKTLKTLTKQLDIHLSLIVQPRGLKEGEKLSMHTLRGGAAIGQALDNLLILERVQGETHVSRLTLEQARHKLAKPGDINLMYMPETTEFVEVDKRSVVSAGNETAPLSAGPRKPMFHRLV